MSKFKIGDLITAYHDGVHVIIDITDRVGMAPLITYQKLLTGKWKPTKRNEINRCDEGFCAPVEDKVSQLKEDLERLMDGIRR